MKKFPSQKGFTLIEVVLVAAIIVIVGGFSVLSLVRWQRARQLNGTTEQLATLIREAISHSMNQSESASWGVYFYNHEGEDPYFSLFHGDPANEVTRYALPSSLKFNEIPGGTLEEGMVMFEQISGQSTGGGVEVIQIAFEEDTNSSSTIEVPLEGAISFTLLNCPFGISACQSTVVVWPPEGGAGSGGEDEGGSGNGGGGGVDGGGGPVGGGGLGGDVGGPGGHNQGIE